MLVDSGRADVEGVVMDDCRFQYPVRLPEWSFCLWPCMHMSRRPVTTVIPLFVFTKSNMALGNIAGLHGYKDSGEIEILWVGICMQ